METLVNQLTKETETLKVQYLEQTEKWANKQFEEVVKRTLWTENDWCLFLGIEPEMRKLNPNSFQPGDVEKPRFPKGFYNTKNYTTYRNASNFAHSLKSQGKEVFVGKMMKLANQHYTESILKLALRITQKGLDVSKMKIQTSKIGINLEMILTDGVKTVKAWTIVAEGEIQKPHYRYLVK